MMGKEDCLRLKIQQEHGYCTSAQGYILRVLRRMTKKKIKKIGGQHFEPFQLKGKGEGGILFFDDQLS